MALISQCVFQFKFNGHDCLRNAHMTLHVLTPIFPSRVIISFHTPPCPCSHWLYIFSFFFLNQLKKTDFNIMGLPKPMLEENHGWRPTN